MSQRQHVTAFVLISIVDRKLMKPSRLCRKSWVTEVHIVAGEYDLVAVIRADSNEKLADIITNVIVNAPESNAQNPLRPGKLFLV